MLQWDYKRPKKKKAAAPPLETTMGASFEVAGVGRAHQVELSALSYTHGFCCDGCGKTTRPKKGLFQPLFHAGLGGAAQQNLPACRNAAQHGWGGLHPIRKPKTGWCKVPPVVPLSPAVSVCTRVSGRMKPPLPLWATILL